MAGTEEKQVHKDWPYVVVICASTFLFTALAVTAIRYLVL